MAGFVETVKIVVDVVADKSAAGLGKIKSDIGDAEGALGKFKAAGSSAFSALSTVGPQAALAAGGAIAAFVGKGISDFQNLALSVGKFSDATGISTEQASKWLEVADHIGVSNSAVTSAFQRMDVAIGKNSAGWQELGIEVAKNTDGSMNLSDTFLRVVTRLQAIEDPAKRAAAAQKLFGKGYAEVAELIGRSAPELASMLNEVGDAKIITEEEVEKARAFRGAMDDLGDATQEVGISLGQQLIPPLTELANIAAKAIVITVKVSTDVGRFAEQLSKDTGGVFDDIRRAAETSLNPVGTAVDTVSRAYDTFLGITKDLGMGSDDLGDKFGIIADRASQMGDRIGPAGTAMGDLGRTYDAAKQSASDMTAEWERGQGVLAGASSETERYNQALLAMNDALLASVDKTFAVHKAQQDYEQQLAATTEVLKDAKATELDKTVATDAAVEAALRAGAAAVEYAGKTDDAEASNQIMIGTLYKLASQTSGPTHDALVALIGDMQKVGQQHPEPTAKLNDQATGPLIGISQWLDRVDGRSATPTIRLNAGPANDALDNLERRLNAASNAHPTVGTGTRIAFAQGGLVPGTPGQAVPATLHGGEYVVPSRDVSAIRRSGSGTGAASGATVVNFNGVLIGPDQASIGRWIDEALAASRRRGNRAG